MVQLRAQVPRVRNIEPQNGYPGQLVNIQGLNLANNTEVTFGGVTGTVISRSDQLIEVEVPPGALFDYVSVLNTANRLGGRLRIPYTMSFGGVPGLASTDFATQVDFSSETGLFDICLCDLDGDGLNDIAGSSDSDIRGTVLLNESTPGNLSFTSQSTLPALNFNTNTLNVSCGDLNGDLRPELIFSENDDGERLFILTNNSTPGNLSFTNSTYTVSGNSTKRMVIHDLDGDGRPEIIVSDFSNPQVSIIKNNSTGGVLNLSATTTNIAMPGVTNAGSLQIADINGDGKGDIVALPYQTTGGGIFVALNQSTSGNIAFGSFTRIELSGDPNILKVADLNKDGRPDLVFSQFIADQIVILPNLTPRNGAVNFGTPVRISPGDLLWGLDLADFDGDGQVDLFVGSFLSSLRTVKVLRNTSSSTDISFSSITIPVNFANRNVSTGDLDGDGKPDAAFASNDDNVSILRNLKCAFPVIEPDGPLTLCSGNTQRLKVQNIPGATYVWQVDGSTEKSGPEPFFDITTLSGDYMVTIQSGGVCSEISAPVAVNVGPGPGLYSSPNFVSPATPICIDGSLNLALEDIPNGGDSFEWRGPNGYTASTASTTAPPLTNFRFVNSGLYEVDIYASGCLIETKSIVVEAVPAPDFNVASTLTGPACIGDPVTLSVSPNDPGYSYAWIDGDGSTVATGPTFNNVPVSGSYFVRATDEVNITCPDIDSNPLTVEILTTPVASIGGPSISCVNSAVSFSDNSTIASGATPQYFWDFGDGNTSSNQNPVHGYASPGDYDITLTVNYQGLNCENSATATITIKPSLEIELVATPEVICEGVSAEIAATQDFETYTWSEGGTTPTITVNQSGSYSLTATDINGCAGSASINIGAFPNPTVEIAADPTRVAPGRPVQLSASGLISYSWEPAELLDDPNSPNPVATLDRPTTFEVAGTDENGCQGFGSIQISVEGNLIGELLDPKNFFSPNPEDNINATWVIEGILEFPQCEVTIYDQTGNMLYQAKPYTNEWDGTTGGRDVPNGVYYFTVNCGSGLAKSGSITVLR